MLGTIILLQNGVNKTDCQIKFMLIHMFNLIKSYSVNIIGVLTGKEKQQKQQHPSTITSNNANLLLFVSHAMGGLMMMMRM